MTCDEVETRGIAEEYLLGRLPESEAEAFEQHYFACARCLEHLEALRAVRGALSASPASAAARKPALASTRAWPWAWLAAAAAAIVAVALSVGLFSGPEAPNDGAVASVADAPSRVEPAAPPIETSRETPPQEPAPTLMARLADVEPPPYAPARLRGAATRPAFDAAMKAYAATDYARAASGLATVVKQAPGAEDARFYLGASQLLAGKADAAIATLAPIVDREESAYVEEARFLTAKAWLRKGDATAARRALDRTIALDGDRAQEARELRRRLDALTH